MALQLIELGSVETPSATLNESDWLYRLEALKQTRHLNIQVRQPSEHIIDITRKTRPIANNDKPPRWFVEQVAGAYPEAEYRPACQGQQS